MKNQFYLKRFKNIATICLTACAIVFLFAGCGKTEDPEPLEPTSGIAIIQMSDASYGGQDAYISGFKVNQNSITYGQVFGYFLVKPQLTTIDFKNSSTSTLNASTTITPVVDKAYSVIFGDNNAIVKAEDEQTLPQLGKARIRFLNVSGYLNQNVDFGGAGGNKLVLNSPINTASTYYEVDPSTTTSITVYPAGNSTAALTTNVSLVAGRVYFYIVSGTSSGSFKGLLLTQF